MPLKEAQGCADSAGGSPAKLAKLASDGPYFHSLYIYKHITQGTQSKAGDEKSND